MGPIHWNIDNKHPVYLQIKSQIRSAVLTGEYPLGSRVPSVRELAAEASVNPNTVQRALTELEAEKLLVGTGTLGRFVTEDPAVIDKLRQAAIREALHVSATMFKALGLTCKEAGALLAQEEEVSE